MVQQFSCGIVGVLCRAEAFDCAVQLLYTSSAWVTDLARAELDGEAKLLGASSSLHGIYFASKVQVGYMFRVYVSYCREGPTEGTSMCRSIKP
jgi:hypothetical protein